jgi:hypothetical protein
MFGIAMLKYALLAALVCSVGVTIATPFWVIEQYVQARYCIYALSCTVAFLLIENWTLVGDLNQKLSPMHALQASERRHVMIIGELSVQNSALCQCNSNLQKYADASLEIMHWRLLSHKAAALSAITSMPVKRCRLRRSMSFDSLIKK